MAPASVSRQNKNVGAEHSSWGCSWSSVALKAFLRARADWGVSFLYLRRGDRSECSRHRRITLLSLPCTVCAGCYRRVQLKVSQIQEEQCRSRLYIQTFRLLSAFSCLLYLFFFQLSLEPRCAHETERQRKTSQLLRKKIYNFHWY